MKAGPMQSKPEKGTDKPIIEVPWLGKAIKHSLQSQLSGSQRHTEKINHPNAGKPVQLELSLK